MTRLEMIQVWARFFSKTTATLDATTKQRCIDYLNVGQRQLLSTKRFARLRDAVVPLTSVANQADYVLIGVSKPLRMWDTTNQWPLYEMSEPDYRRVNIPDVSGTPEFFVWRGLKAVAKQPANASSLFVKSTAAGDTTQTAYIEGVITGGYQRSVSVVLTGTTAVNVSAAVSSWIRVDKFYLSATCVGTVTLTEDSGVGTELAQIVIGRTATPYQQLTLWRTPGGAYDYLLDVTRELTDLAQDTDAPILPTDFHDVLLEYAKREECLHLNDKRYAACAKTYDDRVKDLALWMAESGSIQPYSLGQPLAKPSQLGGWFPAAT